MSSTPTIYAALLQAQKDMGPLLRNATNPHFRSKYADLAAVVETISEPLQKNGLTVFQTTDVTEDGTPILVTTVANEAGHTVISRYPLVTKDITDPQKLGAAVTYARRYSLQSMFLLAPEDDDGNLAATPAPAQAGSAHPTSSYPAYPPGVRGAVHTKEIKASPNKPISTAQRNLIGTLMSKLGVRNDTQIKRFLAAIIGQETLDGLTSADASALIEQLKSQLETPQDGPSSEDVPF